MNTHTHKTPLRALVSGLFEILIFLIVLVVFRFVSNHTSWPLFSGFVDLLFANAPIILIFSVMFMIGEILAAFSFPFNLLFPIFNAVGSVLLVSFLITVLKFLDAYYAIGIAYALNVMQLFLLPLTLLVVLIAGYLSIFIQSKGPEYAPATPSPRARPKEAFKGSPSWEAIGDEFRQMIADLIRKIRNEINRE
jgi:hypothetical protein